MNTACAAVGTDDGGTTAGSNLDFSTGRPTLWTGGNAIRLSTSNGVAWGVSDDGTIVGAIGGNAFVIPPDDPERKPVQLDSRVKSPGWHFTAAYAVDASGRILATGTKNGVTYAVRLAPLP